VGAAPPRPHKKLFYLIQQGIEQGELRAKLTIAQQLLHILDDESISRLVEQRDFPLKRSSNSEMINNNLNGL
jgi:hypothetical protein